MPSSLSPTKSHLPPRELSRRAKLLQDSPYFSGETELHPWLEKQVIFLALAGLKPVSMAVGSHWVQTADGRQPAADPPEEVAKLLDNLGLAHDISGDAYSTLAVVSREPHLIQRYRTATTDQERGELFGYPQTAISALVADSYLWPDKEDRLLAQRGLAGMAFFRLSPDHHDEELAVVSQWCAVLERYGLR